MEVITKVLQKDKLLLEIEDYVDPKKAALLVRERGIVGRLEIRHFIIDQNNETIYSLYGLNEKNKITSAIFPHSRPIAEDL